MHPTPHPESAQPVRFRPEDRADLARARQLLETPRLAIRIASVLGVPIEAAIDALPGKARLQVARATNAALTRAKDWALATLEDRPGRGANNALHSLAAAASGAAGGAVGIAGLAVELPLSTLVIMRSIADIARSEGERKDDPALPAQLLSVFAMGGPRRGDDSAESAYFAIRTGLAKAVSDAARHVSARGLTKEAAPALARLISQVAARFEVQVTQKAAAQIVPVIGAVSGAAINALFIDHFQCMARGHFIVRRLERTYGEAAVRAEYEGLRAATEGAPGAGGGATG